LKTKEERSLEAENQQLREINADLLEALKDCMVMSLFTSSKWDAALAKAELEKFWNARDQ
jgi:hypothetical protein